MSKNRRTRGPTKNLPSYRKHKASEQAVVTLNGVDFYLGAYGTKASKQEYDRVTSEWLANGRRLPADRLPGGPGDLTVNELILAYLQHAQTYYRKNGRPTGEMDALKAALQVLRQSYGDVVCSGFGPLKLKAVRERMITDKDWCRNNVNRSVGRIRRMFKWGVANQMISPSVYQALAAIDGLRRGRSEARETQPITPVPDDLVEAVLPHVSPEVRAMIELQELAGMRPSEVVAMRGCDLTTDGDLWEYRPAEHKTEHHGRDRVVMLGPRSQAIIKPYLRTDTEAFLFSPAAAEAKRRAERHTKRKTPLSFGNRPGTNRKRKPRRAPRDRYTVGSYRRAIHRGCDQTWPAPEGLKPAEVSAWQRDHRWSPNRLRHNRATKLRKRYGVEAARVVLGHASAITTEIYAEADLEAARRIAAEVG